MVRYDYGGDEFIFVELASDMSLEVNFKGLAITRQLREENVEGVLDICPSNASYMIRFNPDVIHPDKLIEILKRIESEVSIDDVQIKSRMIDVPILFEDPWTMEAQMRFRERHQDPESTDIEYVARINGFDSPQELIDAITGYPYLVSMIGFVPGLPWCYQMVPREQQIQAPKYVLPRTYTPELTFGFGGCFAVIYPVQGAGGYQIFGMAAAPILNPEQNLPDFKESPTFVEQGDIFRYRAVDREEFDRIREEVAAGTFKYRMKDITYTPQDVIDDPKGFSAEVLRRLYA